MCHQGYATPALSLSCMGGIKLNSPEAGQSLADSKQALPDLALHSACVPAPAIGGPHFLAPTALVTPGDPLEPQSQAQM